VVEHAAVKILNAHRIMAVSTVRPDGWPQTTVVGYANQGFELVFLIYRSGQKFSNIQHDDRIAIAVASEPIDFQHLQAVYANAHAKQITDEHERQEAWKQLMQRHANLAGSQIPEATEAVFMRARCEHVSMLDFTQGLGHREQLVVNEAGTAVAVDPAG
jgi:nitroimidazol reductase NimA-like FMN-containing flavoprotein (pyridoxamine 5'-phosphate oxidase superfamily)